MQFFPVAESQMRTGINPVTDTRQADYQSASLDFLSTVVSSAFSCQVESSVAQPFSSPVYVVGHVDTELTANGTDICFASLDLTKAAPTWTCILNVTQRDNNPVVDFRGIATGSFRTCSPNTVYAFVVSPLRQVVQPQPAELSFLERNKTAIFVGTFVALFVVLVSTFAFYRLYRYRAKEKQKEKEVREAQQKLEDMATLGTEAVTADPDVDMVVNPLARQLKDPTGKHNMKESDRSAQERAQRQEEMKQLEVENERMRLELERMRGQLHQKRNSADAGPAPVSQPTGETSAPVVTGEPPQRVAFAPQKPKQRNV